MPSSVDAGRVGLGLLAALTGLVVGLVMLYAALPWLVAALAPRLAEPLGLDALSIRVARPGWQSLSIETLELEAGRLHVAAADGLAGYRLTELLAGRMESLRFERVAVRIDEAGETPASGRGVPDIDALLATLPTRRLRVNVLEVHVPAQHFLGHGRLLVADGEIQAYLAGLEPAAAERLELEARRDRAGEVVVRLSERDRDRPPFLSVTFVTGSGRGELTGGMSLDGYAFELAASVVGLPPGQGSLEGSFSAVTVWPLPSVWQASSLDAAVELSADWRPREATWQMAVAAAEGRLRGGVLRGEARGTFAQGDRIATWQGRAEDLEPSGAQGRGTLVLTVPEQSAPVLDLSWTLEPDDVALSGRYQVGDVLAGWLPEDAASPGHGNVSGRFAAHLPRPLPGPWRDVPIFAEGTVQGAWKPGFGELDVRELDGAWRLEGERLSGSFRGALVRGDLALATGLDLDAATLDGGMVKIDGTASLGEVLQAPFTVRHDLEAHGGTLSARTEFPIRAPLARAVMLGWDRPYDITGGRASAEVALGWSASGAVDGKVRLALEKVDAHFRDYRMFGASSDLAFATAADGSWGLAPAGVHVDRVQTGIELRDLTTGVAWAGDTVSIEATRAQLLGGSVGTGPFAYTVSAANADFVIDVNGLDLARVLALEGGHVSGSGTLNGSLPIELRGNEPSVVAGHVVANPPGGVIRITPTLVRGSGQPGLDFALRALEDFRYSSLEADVAYSGAGDLTLAVRLKGRNPDIEGGRPIHYNVTVTENVPTLLRSLRLQEEVTREIERHVTD